MDVRCEPVNERERLVSLHVRVSAYAATAVFRDRLNGNLSARKQSGPVPRLDTQRAAERERYGGRNSAG